MNNSRLSRKYERLLYPDYPFSNTQENTEPIMNITPEAREYIKDFFSMASNIGSVGLRLDVPKITLLIETLLSADDFLKAQGLFTQEDLDAAYKKGTDDIKSQIEKVHDRLAGIDRTEFGEGRFNAMKECLSFFENHQPPTP